MGLSKAPSVKSLHLESEGSMESSLLSSLIWGSVHRIRIVTWVGVFGAPFTVRGTMTNAELLELLLDYNSHNP